MSAAPNEAALRDWIARHTSDLLSCITDFSSSKEAIAARLDAFAATKFQTMRELTAASVGVAVDRRVLLSMNALEGGKPLLLLGSEVPMIESQLPGRNPSADVLALQTQAAAYVIIEAKLTANAARQAVTELSAYGNGLAQRYWGLSSFDCIWLLISAEYRPTVTSALAYQLLVANRCIVPLKAEVVPNVAGDIDSVALTVEDAAAVPDEYICDALFCDQAFDSIAAAFMQPLDHVEVALHCASSAFERTGSSGFCFAMIEHVGPHKGQPCAVFMATLNPFKLYLKALRLRMLVERGMLKRGSSDYLQEIDDDRILVTVNADAATFDAELVNDAADEMPKQTIEVQRSLRELADRELNSQTLAFRTLFNQLISGRSDSVEINTPFLGDWLSPHSGDPQIREETMASVRYFGVLQDIVIECTRCLLEIDDDFRGKTFLEVYQSPCLLLKLLRKLPLNLVAVET
jgi:hypothetical protein